MGIEENYQDLANAIIIQAVNDYIRVLKHGSGIRVGPSRILVTKEELDNFFYGNWFMMLTTMDPNVIVKGIESHVAHGGGLRKGWTHKYTE